MGKKDEASGNLNGNNNTTKLSMEEAEREAEEIYCGVGSCRPKFMQGCANICCMTGALSFAGLATSTLNIYINSQITTLERQFGFNSSVSGILLSCNDFGYLLTTLVMSYLARRLHIPRALSLSTLLFGVSGLLCTIPFFASRGDIPTLSAVLPAPGMMAGGGPMALSNASYPLPAMMSKGGPPRGKMDEMLCSPLNMTLEAILSAAGGNSSGLPVGVVDRCAAEERSKRPSAMSEDGKGLAITCIAIGMIFQGFGKSPRHPFIGTFIDDNVPKTRTTFYLGIISAISIFGPVLAFTLGGMFSRIYITLEETSMSPMDPRWVGAWWLGFLAFGLLGILAAVPTFFFPRRLRPQPKLRQMRQMEKERRTRTAKGCRVVHDLKEFLKMISRLLRSPVYVCVVLAGCVSLFGISGMISFMPKYLETQFMIPTWKANILLGVLNVLSASLGTMVGGVVTSHFKLQPRACLMMMVGVTSFSILCSSTGFFLGCDQPTLNMGASNGDPGLPSEMLTSSGCQSRCDCDPGHFFPTCGADGVTYFSPCHAGCTESQGMSFKSCSCVNTTMTSADVTAPTSEGGGAKPGFCNTDCTMLYYYVTFTFFSSLTATMVIMPGFIVCVRSVSECDKPMAIGVSAFMMSLLGWFLGPLLFGRIIDTCCLLWSSGCDGSGSCTLYDLAAFRIRYHVTFVSARLGCALLYALALIIAKVKDVQFAAHTDEIEVKADSTEGGQPMVEKNGNAAKGDNHGDEEEQFLGGQNIYKGNN